MDLERIKQQFRIRSGRSKQKSKRYPTKPPVSESTAPSTAQQRQQLPNGHLPEADVNKVESPAPEAIQEQREEHQKEPDPQDESEQAQNEEAPEHEIGQDSSQKDPEPVEESAQNGNPDLQAEAPESEQTMAESNNAAAEQSSEPEDFDLAPPKPPARQPSLEELSELLFSSGHLDTLLHHPPLLAKFSAFLQKYIPHCYPSLKQYLETQKAIRAVEYANAVAEGLSSNDTGSNATNQDRRQAAQLDSDFEKVSSACFEALVGNALPSYISYSLVKITSECLTNEITGRSTPVMRDLVGGLSEVFCLTDPNRDDNPIIYASEEFYRLTRYGPEDTLNSNCRFLQGRKTVRASVERLKTAIVAGEEISETLLNYKRDGRPFMNLLMIAPLHDRNGKLKYHIGAQVDVTGLVEGGRALDGFQRYLNRRAADKKREEAEEKRQQFDDEQRRKKRALKKLRDLSEMFDLEESAVVQSNSRSNSLDREDDDNRSIGSIERPPRRVYGDSDASEDEAEQEQGQQNGSEWQLGQAGDDRLSGKLPGVYDSFILIRPAPSLRIVFVSPKLRKLGDVLQTPFLSHVSAPGATLNGLGQSLKTGVPVSAKIHFNPQRGSNRDGTQLKNGSKHEDGKNGRAIWVSCTPLLGADDRIGVWMCVVIEKSKVGRTQKKLDEARRMGPGELVRSAEGESKSKDNKQSRSENAGGKNATEEDGDVPIKPVRIDSDTEIETRNGEVGNGRDQGNAKTLRGQKSVYFDTEQEPELPRREVGMPERTEEKENAQSESATSHSRSSEAVLTPVEEYRSPGRNTKPYSARIPGLDNDVHHDDASVNDYVTTRSPQMPPMRRSESGRVLIEEDDDVLAEDGQFQDDDSIGNASSGPGEPQSSASGPSMKQVNGDPSNDDPEVAPQTPPHTPNRGDSQASKRHDDEQQVNQDDLQASTQTVRRHDINADTKQGGSQTRDSAVSIDSPTQPRRHTEQDTESSPQFRSGPKDGAHTVKPTSGYAQDDEDHQKNVQNWVNAAQSPSSHEYEHQEKTAGSGARGVGMDYLHAGRSRFPNARPSPLGPDPTRYAGTAQTMDEAGMIDEDWCATSPYSVD